VRFRAGQDLVLYLSNPQGIDPETRRNTQSDQAGIDVSEESKVSALSGSHLSHADAVKHIGWQHRVQRSVIFAVTKQKHPMQL
jgi:hypothetical protein